MVTSRYIGRLGNNMFQLAAAIGYAKMYRCEWASDPYNSEVPRWFDFFPHLPKSVPRGQKYLAHDPNTFNYKRIPNLGSCQLMGFFQSKKYFEHCEDDVKEIFKLPITDGMLDYCSIHVRRGDYVKYSDDFPPVTPSYIIKAMQEMTKLGVKKFMFFSDDIPWCKANFKGHEYSEGRNEFEDLSLMASCGHHIIANSTFSWWGAYLGSNQNRHIISPSHKNWFGKNNGVVRAIGSPKDIIPNEWQQIDL